VPHWRVGVALLAGCGGHDRGATQVAAKVNGQELTVHQINFVLQQNPQLAAAVGRRPVRCWNG
jgi:outer membrane lipopolysaccharide assembly protein LptE/RlpB